MTLGEKYDAVMERVFVTDEMRERILANIENAGLRENGRVLRFPNVKRYVSIAACFVIVLACVLLIPRLAQSGQGGQTETSAVDEGNGIVEYASAQELSDAVGFAAPQTSYLPFKAAETAYSDFWGMAQVDYTGAGGETASLRKAPGTDDVSGDYNEYSDVKTIPVGGLSVTLKGEGGAYVLAVWSADGYSYSLSLSEGAGQDVWQKIMENISQ